MREPETITCDLCGGAIAGEARVINISVPLTAALKKEVVDIVTRHMPKGMLQLVPVERIVPDRWPLECCGCVLSLLPMLKEKLAADVRRHIARRHAMSSEPAQVEDLEEL